MTETIDAAIARLTREIEDRTRWLEALREVSAGRSRIKIPQEARDEAQRRWNELQSAFLSRDGVTGCTCPIGTNCNVTGCPRRSANRATLGGHG